MWLLPNLMSWGHMGSCLCSLGVAEVNTLQTDSSLSGPECGLQGHILGKHRE